jgi:hypothetical protein
MTAKYKLFQYCHVQKKVVPVEEIQKRVQSNARDLFIQDEMEPTRNPLNSKEIYTSKSKLRAAYRAAGAVEVGDSYDRGYTPERETSKSSRDAASQLKRQIIERMNNGR